MKTHYKSYLLKVLLLILAFNTADRLSMGILLQSIKADLSLSDTQLGVLTGIAFALFYSLMGIPIARWADRGNRVMIISVTTALWSAAVALCGLTTNFLQLLLARISVAIGEAGCIPPAHSLIADNFERAERPRAVAQYMLGGSLSVVLGFFLAGWLNQLYGWRVTFMLLGLPGVVLGIVAWLTLKEPRFTPLSATARGVAPAPDHVPEQFTFAETCVRLWANRTFLHLLFCFAITSFFSQGIGKWQPAFFIRSYGLQTGELGTWFAIVYGLGSLVGIYWGGELASRRAARNEPLQLRVMGLMYATASIIWSGIYLSPNQYLAFALMWLAAVWGGLCIGPLLATVHVLVPDRMRAMAIALFYLFANLIGMGLGPLAAGVLSDQLRPWFGDESLRYALLALCPGYAWGGWHCWRASKSVVRDMQA